MSQSNGSGHDPGRRTLVMECSNEGCRELEAALRRSNDSLQDVATYEAGENRRLREALSREREESQRLRGVILQLHREPSPEGADDDAHAGDCEGTESNVVIETPGGCRVYIY